MGTESDDYLDEFTESILSQYASGLNPPISVKTNNLKSPDSYSGQSAETRQSHPDHGLGRERDSEVHSENMNTVLNKVEILYTMSSKLQSLWEGIYPIVVTHADYSKYNVKLQKPLVWEKSNSITDIQLESISSWIEISSNILCILAKVLNVNNKAITEYSGSEILQKAIDDTYSGFSSDISKAWDESNTSRENESKDLKNEYLRIIKFNTKLQFDYERIIDKLKRERDSALLQAKETYKLEDEIRSFKGKLDNLSSELSKKEREIEELRDTLQAANRIQFQMMQKNEQLITQNQKLIMDKENFIDKDMAKELIKQYHDHEHDGGQKKDIVDLLKRMLDVDEKSDVSEDVKDDKKRSLLSEFIEFLNDNSRPGGSS